MNYEADGMDQDRHGQWFSYSYSVWDGRIVRLAYFDHVHYADVTHVLFAETL